MQCVAACSAALGDVHTVFPLHHHLPHAVLPQAKQSLATLTKDVPKRHSLAMPGETVLNGNQEWVMQADLPLTAAIRQSQQTLYHSHPQHSADRQGGQTPSGEEGRWSNHSSLMRFWECIRGFAGVNCVLPLPRSGQSEPLPFPAAVHHLRRLRGRG